MNVGGTLAPGLSPGIINTGNLSLGGATAIEILGPALGTQYDNVNVTGTVTIAGGTLSLTGAYVPAPGDVFAIVSNDGADAVTGTFAGLPKARRSSSTARRCASRTWAARATTSRSRQCRRRT